jgi:hypothetical protein
VWFQVSFIILKGFLMIDKVFASWLVFVLTMIVLADVAAADLRVEQAWARSNPPVVPNSAAYMVIHNSGAQQERLLGVSGTVAKRIELHESYMENGVMKMRHQDQGLVIPGAASLTLKPGGLHVMLMGLHEPLQLGQSFTLTLQFEHAGQQTVVVTVGEAAPEHE